MASGRLVLVGNRTGKKELYLCDADGADLVQLTKDNSISLAPRWSPDGRTIVYTSYLKGFPDLYSIDVASGSRRIVANYPGLNTGGAISPNGREMALILSRTGNPGDIRQEHRLAAQLTRLTTTPQRRGGQPGVVAGRQPDCVRVRPGRLAAVVRHLPLGRAAPAADRPGLGERGARLGGQRMDRLFLETGRALPDLHHESGHPGNPAAHRGRRRLRGSLLGAGQPARGLRAIGGLPILHLSC